MFSCRQCARPSGEVNPRASRRPQSRLAPGDFSRDGWGRMPRIPLEDNFTDVIGKAQRGLRLGDDELARAAGIPVADLRAVQKGEIRENTLLALAPRLGLERNALVALARREWYPEQPLFARGFAMFNTAFEDMTVNSYLAWDSKTRLAAAFDTGASAQGMRDTITAEGLTLRYIFLTHTHPDHIADIHRLADTGAEIWSSELEPLGRLGAKTFQENAHFHLGELSIKTLITWGHSPGQTSYFISGLAWPLAIVGDSLFAGSMGGSATHYEVQLRNNRQKLLKLPGDTVFACGHGPLTTLKQERRHNPFFAL
jgi:hydroxyacylglutathione hydrolase